METYTVTFPGYTVSENDYAAVPAICSAYGKTAVIIGGKKAMGKAKDLVAAAVAGSDIEIIDFLWFGGEAAYENVAILKMQDSVQKADMIFAVGGGKVMDTCKVLAQILDKPYFTFPTIASNCAAFTSLAVMYRLDGSFKELSFSKVHPIHVFLCLNLFADAPSKYLWAGMGDTIAKYYEATLSARGKELEYANAMGVQLSALCAEPIFRNGQKALADNVKQVLSRELEQTALAIVVTTGMVSNYVTQDYNGHIAHALYCSLVSLPQIEKKHLHGEVVAYGVLILLACDENSKELARMVSFCRTVGLPTCLEDIDVTMEEMEKILDQTVESQELVCSPYEVKKTMLRDAVLYMEAYAKQSGSATKAVMV